MPKKTEKHKLPVLPYGEGSMSYMPDGRIIFKKTIDKKRVSVYGETVKEVLQKMRDKEKELAAKKKDKEKIANHSELLYEGLIRWLEKYKKLELKESSYNRIEDIIENQIKKYPIGYMEINAITSDDVQDLMKTLIDKNYSYSTIKKTYELLNDFFKFSYANDPFKNIMLGTTKPTQKNIKVQVKQIDFFENSDIKKIVEAAKLTKSNGAPVYKLGWGIVGIMYTGMRASEALALKWENIDLVNNEITIEITASIVKDKDKNSNKSYKVIYTSPKTAAGKRVIPLAKNAIDAFTNLKNIQDPKSEEEFVFATSSGNPIGLRNIRRTFNSMQKRVNTDIQNSGMHVLRHTFCSLLVRNGVDKVVIANILGQEGTDMIEKIYQHVTKKEKTDAIKSIDETTILE